MGVELDKPVINEQALAMNLTNEVGACGKIRLLKNIAGLWVLQECKRAWELDGIAHSYEKLAAMAKDSEPFIAVLNPDAFLEPGNMPSRIEAYCRATSQKLPTTPGEFARCILESLALRYRQVLENLETLIGRSLGVIHIVGGGSKNELLNQLVADATGRIVIAGPSEATAAGNVLIQAMGAGDLSGLDQAREVVRNSFGVRRFEPSGASGWAEAYERFQKL
jgi:rhamnulokinase